MKTSNVKTPITLAEFLAKRTAALKALNEINALEPQVHEQSTKRIADLLNGLPAQIHAITGTTPTIGEIAQMVSRHAKGTFDKGAKVSDRTKRVSAENRIKMTDDLAERAALKAAGKPYKKIGEIGDKYGFSAQTVNAYENKRLASEKAKAAIQSIIVTEATAPEAAAV